MKHRALIIATLALLGAHGTAFAGGPFTIDWFTIDGGGSTVSGGPFEVSGTIGQPDAAEPLAGGTFSLVGGFWTAAVPPPCPGDADGNGSVIFSDITAVLANYGMAYGPTPTAGLGDADGNGIVNFADITVVLANFNFACPTN